MLRLTCKIEINQKSGKTWIFDKISSCEITRDSDTLTDTCILKLPRKVRWQTEEKNPLRRGDQISVYLGYDNQLQLAFKGYITTVGIKTPIVITCEDEMFTLKQKEAIPKTYSSVTIDQLLKDQELGVPYKVFGEQSIGAYRITAKTVTELFGHLKDNGGIRTFFRMEDGEAVLYSGVLFPFGSGYSQVFATGVNIIKDDQLDQQKAEDVRLKIKAISLLPDNKKVKVEIGDVDGEVRTIHAYNKTEKELKVWAEQEMERLKRDGLVGSFTTFGHRLIDKLENVAVKIEGERMGIYQVEKNVIKYDSGGFRQEITIGGRVAE